MKDRFRMFRCGRTFYFEDAQTGKQESLRTRHEREARRLVEARNDAVRTPYLNIELPESLRTRFRFYSDSVPG